MNFLYTIYFIFISIFFIGCGATNEPQPLKPSFKSKKINYNKALSITNNKNMKIYIDNRFDLKRKDEVIECIYNDLIDERIRYDNGFNKTFYPNILHTRSSEVLINSQINNKICILFCNKSFHITNRNLKKASNGIIIDELNDVTGIQKAYRSTEYQMFNYGMSVKLKLDTKAMEKGIAHFTDEYLLKYSLKNSLKKQLELQGYNVIDNIKDANVVFLIENLGFANLDVLDFGIKYPKSNKVKYKDLLKNIFAKQKDIKNIDMIKLDQYKDDLISNIKYVNSKNPTSVATHKEGLALDVVVSLIGGNKTQPYGTVNSIKIFQNQKEIGSILSITAAKNNVGKNYILKRTTYKYNTVLSDELIDDLNKQAAKQVLSKIKFIEK